jgi:hypothetical protein
MPNNYLSPCSKLQNANMDKNRLTRSLLDEGILRDIFSPDQAAIIQGQLMALLSTMILEYTHYESSSVKTETAQNIFQSIIYCCDACLRDYPPEAAAKLLLTVKINSIYHQGLQRVREEVEQSKKLYAAVQNSKLDIPLIAYQDTIDSSLAEFLENYDVDYDAHNTAAPIDYPLLKDNLSLTGIFYIKNYL